MSSPFERAVRDALRRGLEVLLRAQRGDGFWYEFEVRPGASDTWVSGWVGWCVATSMALSGHRSPGVEQACRRAAAALVRCRRDKGWGFNRACGPDADSTAWVLRFLAAMNISANSSGYLAPYIDAGGGVHTFVEPHYSPWTDAHDDVASNVGLALLADPGARPLMSRVRQRLLSRCPVATYWWTTPSYGQAWALRFLQASDRLEPACIEHARGWLSALPAPASCFDAAHRLMMHMTICAGSSCSVLQVNRLLDELKPDGWPGAAVLRIPPRQAAESEALAPELRGTLTTSICVRALAEWLGRVRQEIW